MINAPGPRTGVTAAHPGQAAMVAVVVNIDKAGLNPAVTAAATPHDAIFPQVTTGV
jgi:hypothetical protein